MVKENKPLTTNGIIGTWTGVAFWLVIMTFLGWWTTWWAYFPLIGVISGAIQQTVSYNQQKNTPVEPNYIQPTSGAPIQGGEAGQISYCPGCGGKIAPNLTQCPTCGFALK